MRTWLTVAASCFVVLSLVAVGCGGDGEGGPSETGAPADRPAQEAMLKRVAPTLDDLPSGFALQQEGFADNEEAAESDPEGKQAALERFNEWGRLLGYQASYMTSDPLGAFMEGGTALITVNLNIFETPEGAAAGMEWGRELVADPGQASDLLAGVTALEGEAMSFPAIGDESLAARFTGTFRPQGTQFDVDVDFVAHLVAIRRGWATAHILVAAIGGATPGQEVEEIIRTLDGRLVEEVQ